MATTYWHRQDGGKPLFPDMVWSRPEHRGNAGKLLVIGGNAHGFAAPGEAYQVALESGVGVVRVLLPQALKNLAGRLLESVDYAASTPSGSFAKTALIELLAHTNWADGTILAGDLGRNSETAILIEKFLTKYSGQVTITKDATDYAVNLINQIIDRPDTLLVLTMAQLQKLFTAAHLPEAISFDMGIPRLVEVLHNLTLLHPLTFIVKQLDHLVVASGGEVSTSTTTKGNEDFWRVAVATKASVWWLQNPGKPFEAITTSVLES